MKLINLLIRSKSLKGLEVTFTSEFTPDYFQEKIFSPKVIILKLNSLIPIDY